MPDETRLPLKLITGAPLTLCGIPVRLDATLCGPEELWIEGPRGHAVRIWPKKKQATKAKG